MAGVLCVHMQDVRCPLNKRSALPYTPLQVVIGLIVAITPESYLRTTRVCAAMSPRRCRLAEAITAIKPTR